MVGQRFHHLTVVAWGSRDGYASPMPRFDVRCDCGRVVNRIKNHVVYGRTKCCGHDKCPYRVGRRTDKTGKRYGKLLVLRLADGFKIRQRVKWWVRCDCGAEKAVSSKHLTENGTQSCGSSACKDDRHGMSYSPEYRIWSSMKRRCNDSNDKFWYRYGGRGIKVCKRWEKFENFYKDVGPRPTEQHSIDRIKNDGNYSPSNVKWSTAEEQASNKSCNHMITKDGVTMNATQWERFLGLPKGLVGSRKHQGVKDLLAPVRGENTITYAGQTFTVKQWAKRLKLPYGVLSVRRLKGLPVEKILFKGNLRDYNKKNNPNIYIPAHVRVRMKSQ